MEFLRGIMEFWPLITTGGLVLAGAALFVLSGRFITRAAYDADAASLATIAERLTARTDQIVARVDELERRQYQFDRSLSELGSRLDAMPTDKSLRELVKAQHKTNEQLSTIAGRMEGLTRNVDLLMQVHTPGGHHNG